MFVTVTCDPPSSAAMLPQKSSAATTWIDAELVEDDAVVQPASKQTPATTMRMALTPGNLDKNSSQYKTAKGPKRHPGLPIPDMSRRFS